MAQTDREKLLALAEKHEEAGIKEASCFYRAAMVTVADQKERRSAYEHLIIARELRHLAAHTAQGDA